LLNLNKLQNISGGLRSCGIGGLIGFSLATIYSLISTRIKVIDDLRKTIIHLKY